MLSLISRPRTVSISGLTPHIRHDTLTIMSRSIVFISAIFALLLASTSASFLSTEDAPSPLSTTGLITFLEGEELIMVNGKVYSLVGENALGENGEEPEKCEEEQSERVCLVLSRFRMSVLPSPCRKALLVVQAAYPPPPPVHSHCHSSHFFY